MLLWQSMHVSSPHTRNSSCALAGAHWPEMFQLFDLVMEEAEAEAGEA